MRYVGAALLFLFFGLACLIVGGIALVLAKGALVFAWSYPIVSVPLLAYLIHVALTKPTITK